MPQRRDLAVEWRTGGQTERTGGEHELARATGGVRPKAVENELNAVRVNSEDQ